MLRGCDISQWQGQPNFDLIKKAVDFLTIRAGYGNSYTDQQFARNRSEARRVGILHGFYWYSYPQYNKAADEARAFVNVIGELQEGEELDLDFEESYSGDPVAWCLEFLNTVSTLLGGYKPLLYINKSMILAHDWKPIVDAGFGLWAAHYDGNPNGLDFDTPWVDANGNSIVAFKQYASNGVVSGIVGNVDMDTFWGDAKTFAAYGYHKAQTVPVPPTQPPTATGDSTLVDLGDLGMQTIGAIHSKLIDMQRTITNQQNQIASFSIKNFTWGEISAEIGRRLTGGK